MMTALGLTAEQVGQMTMNDAADLFAYWRRFPPPAEVIRAAFGPPQSSGPSSSPPPSGPITPEDEDRSAAILAAVFAGAGR